MTIILTISFVGAALSASMLIYTLVSTPGDEINMSFHSDPFRSVMSILIGAAAGGLLSLVSASVNKAISKRIQIDLLEIRASFRGLEKVKKNVKDEYLKKQGELKEKHIVYDVLKEKLRSYRWAYLTYFCVLILLMISSWSLGLFGDLLSIGTGAIFFIIFMLVALFIKERVMVYRADHGLYGTSFSEAREIIRYLERHRNDDNNSNGNREIFNPETEAKAILERYGWKGGTPDVESP